ncbi:MAG: oligopeptide/dipeptide ABC transporter ATP-binding protein [Acidobacteriota bacterium]
MTLLKIRRLKTYFPIRRGPFGRAKGCVRAVDGVSFEIARGTTLGLVGESGCGKTTLGRSILRLIEPTGGEVWFDDVDVRSASKATLAGLRRNMQIVFQDVSGSLNPRMTVGRIIAEPLVLHGVTLRRRRERVAELLAETGLRPADADRYPHELSGGQRQRVGIARAIALHPKFVVCDEPVSALDVSVQSQILNLLSDLQRKLGLTYLFIAHNLAVVEHVSDRVAVMYLGKIVEIADASDLYHQPRHPYTMALLAAVPDLDPARRRKRTAIAGDVPSPVGPPGGCAFHPRCPYATDECRRMTPPLGAQPGLSTSHLVACHHVDKIPPG